MSTEAGVIGRSTKSAIATARGEIDERQKDRLRIVLADPAGGERADDVEEADQRERPRADPRIETLVDDIGRQMRGDEGDMEAADEEAGGQQQVAPVRERLARAPGRMSARGSPALPRPACRQARCERTGIASVTTPRARERLGPAETLDQRLSERREDELAHRPGSCANAEHNRALLRRHAAPEGGEHDREGCGRHAEADHHAGGDVRAKADPAPTP